MVILAPFAPREMFGTGCLEVERFCLARPVSLYSPAIVSGRLDDAKTEYSEAPLPLDPALAEVTFEWRRKVEGLPDSMREAHGRVVKQAMAR